MMEVVEATKAGSKYYIFNDYIYLIDKRSGATIYYKCRDKSCGGRVVSRNEVIDESRDHSHFPEPEECQKFRFRQDLLKTVSTSDGTTVKKVFYDVAENHQDAATSYTFTSAECRMRKKRRDLQPPPLGNMCTLRDFLQSQDWQHLGKTLLTPPQPFYDCLLQADDSSEIMVFVSPTIASNLNVSRSFHIDGTFKILPQGLAQQLTTIHTVYLDKVYCAIYAIMTRRTKLAYVKLFEYVKNTLFTEMNPLQSMSDYEAAERLAIAEVFPGIDVKGCWFHYSQIGLANLSEEFSTVLAYLQEYWLDQVGAAVMSVFGCSRRTNNDVENFHLQLFDENSKHPHPSLWNFIRILRQMDKIQSLKFRAHERGARHCHGRKKSSIMQDRNIKKAEDCLISGRYTVGEFMETTAHSVTALEKRLRFQHHAAITERNADAAVIDRIADPRLEEEMVDDPELNHF